MPTPYYTLLTAIGAAELVNAQASGVTVPLTHLAIGDGNGALPAFTEATATLAHEVHRVPVSSITADMDNPNWLVVEAVLPAAIGGWTAREVGLIGGVGAGGKLIAVGTFPATYKPVLAEGSARDLVVRMIVQVGNASAVQLTVDPSVAVATNQSIANAIAAHEAKANPHPQYMRAIDGAALILAHVGTADPHTQYYNAARLAAHLSNKRAQRYYFASGM